MAGRGKIERSIPSIFCSTVKERDEFKNLSDELFELKNQLYNLQRLIRKIEARRQHIRNRWYYRRGKNGGTQKIP